MCTSFLCIAVLFFQAGRFLFLDIKNSRVCTPVIDTDNPVFMLMVISMHFGHLR